ncbi:GNAT family N-acetyltransferase [Dyella dinghuensis]|uniref:GNAT family N-acetyltransferase n=1 Tax=Dyella dinghuensis TaxID=1920169 RepID=A0A3S0RDX9_9GAMM|nr:GNAT family N-acetyltransferase [Dyella dinghuensis]RUL63460.1 GNAT family N-acetyltransferase [Dyella dinghuensis]
MFTVRPYAPADAGAWDALVGRSRNGNFLHLRGYMDYHAERFVDASLVIERDGDIEAVFPANLRGTEVVSHAGLTYAGLIATPALRAESTLSVFQQVGDHYRALGVERIVYKAIPHVFHQSPAEEDLYALHRLGARLKRRDISSVISLQDPFHFTDGRKQSIGKARKAGVRIQTGGDIAEFHALLTETLRKHHAVPTHNLQELRLLQSRFPQNIVLHEAHVGDELHAGVLVYDFGKAVHTQYMASSEDGRRSEALSFLLAELINTVYADRKYFSFGISSEEEGTQLNSGLIAQKEYFGARAVVHDFYEWVL